MIDILPELAGEIHDLLGALTHRDANRVKQSLLRIRERYSKAESASMADEALLAWEIALSFATRANEQLQNFLGGWDEHRRLEGNVLFMRLIRHIAENSSADQRTLATALHLDPAQLSRALKELETLGFIVRHQEARSKVPELTPFVLRLIEEHDKYCRRGINCPLKQFADSKRQGFARPRVALSPTFEMSSKQYGRIRGIARTYVKASPVSSGASLSMLDLFGGKSASSAVKRVVPTYQPINWNP